MDKTPGFLAARPVWPAGRERQMNDFVGFRATVPRPAAGTVLLRFTTPYIAKVLLNGEFLAYGPARAAHGHYRVDDIDLTPRLRVGDNVLAIEVAGYNVNSYYFLDQPSFFLAEVLSGTQVLAATGREGFIAVDLPERIRAVQRYSFQRPFSEVYSLHPDCHDWRTAAQAPGPALPCTVFPLPCLLPRRVPYPEYGILQPVLVHDEGSFVRGEPPEKPWRDRSLTAISPILKGFPEAELAWIPSLEYQRYRFALRACPRPYAPEQELPLQDGRAVTLDLGTNRTGFIGFRIRVRRPTRLIVAVDEVLQEDGGINIGRIDVTAVPSWDLEPGDYAIETFEPYTLRFLRLCVPAGDCVVTRVQLRDYAAPALHRARLTTADPELNAVIDAAVETARQNAVDLFYDDPSRERAGWLCDAFFQARAWFDLTGSTAVEHAFLENLLLAPDPFPNLPDGEIPGAYPADFYEGLHIPQWPMYLVLQLEEYRRRSGHDALVDAFARKIEGFFAFLARHRNADGLLEGLPGWNFIEWSFVNECMQDVNYPTNMLYAAALDAAARTWKRPDWAQEAARVRTAVLRQSWDGEFFVDNAVRADGALRPTRNRTECCQYFAFWLGLATPDSHPQLWRLVLEQLGPARDARAILPEIHPANALIGYLVRFELLARHGLASQLVAEMKTYYARMAERTGTLWEHNDLRASACQGFASHVVTWMIRSVLGIERVDPVARRIVVRPQRIPLPWLDARLPLPDGELELRWRQDRSPGLRVPSVPAGWQVVEAAPAAAP